MDILTKTVSPFFRHRQRKIELYATETDRIQARQLQTLLHKARNTQWGLKYDYKNIRNYTDFRERVPLQTYEDLKPYITRMINGEKNVLWPSVVRWYARSSGTTNDKSKFIPVTDEILWRCHYKGGVDCVALYLQNNPSSRFFSKKGLILGGSHSPSPLNKQAHQGDLSAVLLQNLNPLVNIIRVPPKRIILMDEWESKIQAIVKSTINKDVNSLSGVPSWMLVLIKAVLEKAGKQYLTEVWPNMEVFFHGGISFEPYRDQYKALIPSDKMHYVETYNASEGFFGIQNDFTDQSLLMMQDYGTFYEFIPLNEINDAHPTILPLEAVETDKNYAMVISTLGGLWRYQIGDTVRFTSLFPHKYVISGRTKHYINAFGEELMVDNADKAIAMTSRMTGAKVKEYTAAPLFMLDKAKGCHQWFIEFLKMPPSLNEFATLLDQTLQSLNSDYEAKRYKEISLQPLEIVVAREGAFYDWLKQKGKLGGQHKIPRLSNDRTHIEELLAMNLFQ
ncbi:GH3 auxin-responsive promoter family protein [Parabacteroides sp. PF5-9]|uniref:GH3 auxin-responsive promoter family protein n=1 Tax=Parabacteroides sp. PF5-9 TaxID=1742404 RepID=UPI00247709AD|nr:GH3 auxin-responsive promoter family protein [Parabacteroides sp. PF5-9]